MSDIYDSTRRVACPVTNEQTGKHQHLKCCIFLKCVSLTASTPSSQPGFYHYTHSPLLNNASQCSQRRTPTVRCICFCTQVTFDHASNCEIPGLWNRHFRIMTTGDRCVVSGIEIYTYICFLAVRSLDIYTYICLWSRVRILDYSVGDKRTAAAKKNKTKQKTRSVVSHV